MPSADPALLENVRQLVARMRHLRIIAIVGPGVIEHPGARKFIALNCIDYQTLPLDMARLQFALGHAEGMASLSERVHDLDPTDGAYGNIVGNSTPIQMIRAQLHKIAASDAPALITGETGTGKELVARAIHQHSRRSGHPFIAVNCVALSPTLIHAELFGFERGAFTGANKRRIGHLEAANRGVVFLDEIGDLDAEMQVLLLRFLEEKKIRRVGGSDEISLDVRVIAATHVDLEAAVQSRRFREDLYYRLNVLRIDMPPLRDRLADIELLAAHLLERYSNETTRRVQGFQGDAFAAMRNYTWPGNVRELTNRVRRAIAMSDGGYITAQDLQLPAFTGNPNLPNMEEARNAAERQTLLAALEAGQWSVTRAATIVGVSRATFYRLATKHGLNVDASGTYRSLWQDLPERPTGEKASPAN